MDGYLSTTEMLSTSMLVWAGAQAMPFARSLCGAAAVSSLLCVAGGFQGARQVVGACAAMDADGAWRELPPMPTPRAGCGCVAFAACLYVVGGCDAGGRRLADFERLNLTSAVWEKLTPMPTPRRGCATAALGGRLFVFGGSDAHNEERSSRVTAAAEQAILGPEPQWTVVPNMPTKRYACAGGVLLPWDRERQTPDRRQFSAVGTTQSGKSP